MDTLPTELARRIKAAREARGLTQKQLADRAGIGKTAMFDLEHGNPGVRLNTLLAVLQELEISLQVGESGVLISAAPPLPSLPESGSDGGFAEEDLPDRLL